MRKFLELLLSVTFHVRSGDSSKGVECRFQAVDLTEINLIQGSLCTLKIHDVTPFDGSGTFQVMILLESLHEKFLNSEMMSDSRLIFIHKPCEDIVELHEMTLESELITLRQVLRVRIMLKDPSGGEFLSKMFRTAFEIELLIIRIFEFRVFITSFRGFLALIQGFNSFGFLPLLERGGSGGGEFRTLLWCGRGGSADTSLLTPILLGCRLGAWRSFD